MHYGPGGMNMKKVWFGENLFYDYNAVYDENMPYKTKHKNQQNILKKCVILQIVLINYLKSTCQT